MSPDRTAADTHLAEVEAEQAALRRIAALLARSVPAEEVFDGPDAVPVPGCTNRWSGRRASKPRSRPRRGARGTAHDRVRSAPCRTLGAPRQAPAAGWVSE